MRILFIDEQMPGAFEPLIRYMAAKEEHFVVLTTSIQTGQEPSGVWIRYFGGKQAPLEHTHGYTREIEQKVKLGQQVFRVAHELGNRQFVPDIVVGHAGTGTMLFLKECFPQAKVVCYCDWFFRANSQLFTFDEQFPMNVEIELSTRVRNVPMLTDLASCDVAFTETEWQRDQFPEHVKEQIKVLPLGIDCQTFAPLTPDLTLNRLNLPQLQLDLPPEAEILVSVELSQEPLRGFPSLLHSIALLQERRPNFQAIVVGPDVNHSSYPREDEKSYREGLLADLDGKLDLDRLHFVDAIGAAGLVRILHASSVFLSLSWPYKVSETLLQAMAAGCLVVGSDTPTIKELINEGENGFLTDFFDVEAITERIETAIELDKESRVKIATAARDLILEEFNIHQQIALLEKHFVDVID